MESPGEGGSGVPEASGPVAAGKLFADGPRCFLCDLEAFDVRSGEWPVSFNGQLGNGKDFIKVGGVLSPRGIGMHPPGSPKYAAVKYRLGKRAALMRAVVAINDTTDWCWSPAVFTVLGDGKVLWQSTTIAHAQPHQRSQECSVNVSKVNVLELRVHVVNGNAGVHAVWAEPRVLQTANTPDEEPAKPQGISAPPAVGAGSSPPTTAVPAVKLFADAPRRFLVDLDGFDTISGPWPVTTNGQVGDGTNLIKVGGTLSPHGIGMHPPNAPAFASIKYRLDKEAVLFKSVVAINDTTTSSISDATFTVLGDGRALWQSVKISPGDARSQECRVDITGVRVLELRVQARGANQGVHAVWVEPRILQTADTPDESNLIGKAQGPSDPPKTAPVTSEPPKKDPDPPKATAGPTKLFADGPRHFLSDLESFDVKHGPWPVSINGQLGNGKDSIKVNGVPSPKGIGMHPPWAPKYASASYRLNKEATVFRAVVGLNDTTDWGWSPATFTVLGDGKPLWQSKDIGHGTQQLRFQECSVDVSGVNVLELRVQVLNGSNGVQAVWVEPRVLKTTDTPDKK